MPKPKPAAPAIPKVPFSIRCRADYIKMSVVVCKDYGGGLYGAVYYTLGLEHLTHLLVHESRIDFGWRGKGDYYLDGEDTVCNGMKGAAGLAPTHLGNLKLSALKDGATPEAIWLLKQVKSPKVPALTSKEEATMADKLKAKNTAAAAKGAAKGGAAKAGAADKPKGKGNPEALKKAREAKAAAGPDTRKITIVNKENPYRADSNRAASFNALTGSKTVEDYAGKGGKTKYLTRWVEEGRIKLV